MPGRPACLVVGSEHRSLPNRGQQAALGEINVKLYEQVFGAVELA